MVQSQSELLGEELTQQEGTYGQIGHLPQPLGKIFPLAWVHLNKLMIEDEGSFPASVAFQQC